MEKIQRYDWNTGEKSATGEHVCYSAHEKAIAALEAQLAEANAELLALRWRPITETDLPVIGEHEVRRKRLADPKGPWLVSDVADTPLQQPATAKQPSSTAP